MVEQAEGVDDDVDDAVAAGRKRARSLIEFPYTDLERSVELAQKLHTEGGQAKVDQTQLAVAMDQSVAGGTFRSRLSAAKMFGLIETESGLVWLTPLGLQVLDEGNLEVAKAEAFLKIPLYNAMFQRYNGFALPPPAAIERQMEALGVPTKQKERARQAFAASAAYAGYIASNGRFSKPLTSAKPPPKAPEERADASKGDGSGGGGSGDGGSGGIPDELKGLHPFIRGLFTELPPAKTEWSVEQRVDWLQAAAQVFKLIYSGSGGIDVTVTGPRSGNGG